MGSFVGALDQFVAFGVEICKIQVAVGIYQHDLPYAAGCGAT